MRKAMIVAVLVVIEIAILVAMVAAVSTFVGPGSDWTLCTPLKATIAHELEVPVEAGQVLEIRNPIGRITINGGAAQARATATVSGYGATAADAQRAAEQVEVTVQETPSGQAIKVMLPQRMVRAGPSDSVALDVWVPAGVSLVVVADMGRITLSEHVGDARVTAAMGEVAVKRHVGDLDIDAKMGAVNVVGSRITDVLRISAAMGSITFSGYPGQTGRITASMGSVSVKLDEDVAVDITARTQMGSVSTSLPFSGERDRTRLEGRLGTGEPVGVLIIEASMGSIGIK